MDRVFRVPAMVVYFAGGLLGLLVCLRIISTELGFLGMVIALVLFPISLYAAPWYAVLVHGNWAPMAIVYGSGITAAVLYAIGSIFERGPDAGPGRSAQAVTSRSPVRPKTRRPRGPARRRDNKDSKKK